MTAPFKSLRLYNFFNSSVSWRVRLILNWKNLNYEYVPVHLVKEHHLNPEYAKINPMRQIPALEVDGKHIIVESMAIAQFLEDTVPEPPLLPKDPIKKAQIIAFCEMINSGIHPKIVVGTTKKIEELGQNKSAWTKYWMNRGYKSLEEYLKDKRGKYCFGDTITLGDMFFLPMTEAGLLKFGLEIDDLPNVQEILANLRQVPQLQKAYPKNQPDAEK